MNPVDTNRVRTTGPPGVSIVIPTYNREALLREAIASVFNQTYADWELIVADDGSTDGTRDYLAGLRDQRVKTLALDHCGNMARMRNIAIAHARGEWIAFLDSDDLWLPQKLELQLRCLTSNPECDWSCTGFEFIDATGTRIPQRSGEPYRAHSGWIRERLLTFAATATIQSLMVRRAVLVELGVFDEAFLTRADYDLELRLAARSQICALPETLVVIREHTGRMTKSERVATLLQENERVFRKAADASTNARMRRVCRQQCAMQLTKIAGIDSREGAHRAALRSVLSALRETPFSPRVWRCMVGVVTRAAAFALT